MSRRGRVSALVTALVAVGSIGVGGATAASRSGDEAALGFQRGGGGRGVEGRVESLLRQMTLDEKLQQLTLLSDGQMKAHPEEAQQADRRRLLRDRSGADRQVPARRGRALAAAHPDPVRVRHDPRLPDHLPDAAGDGVVVRSRRRLHRPQDRRLRVGRRRPQADLLADGRRVARAALGAHRRGRRRGPVPQQRDGGVPSGGRAGPRLLRARQDGDVREALRGLRAAGERARLQHDRHVGVTAAEHVSAAVQGRDRRRRGHGHVLVQLDQRQAGLREPVHRDATSSRTNGASTASSRATTPRSPSCGPARA